VCCALVFALGGAAIAGCTASAEDVRAPEDQLFFPTGLAATSDEQTLFVVNANSELRYDSGSINVIDIGVVQSVVTRWVEHPDQALPDGCSRDLDHSETLQCEEAMFFKKGAGVRVGNFATDLTIQDFTGTGGAADDLTRVFVPTRGDPSITWADYRRSKGALSCTADTDSNALCDDAHRLTSVLNSPDLPPVPSEPFSAFADATNGFAMVTHLSSGAVSLIRAPADSSKVAVVDVLGGVFAADAGTGLRGATGIAGRTPTAAGDMVYVASNTERRIQTFTVGDLDIGGGARGAAYLLPGNYFFLSAVGLNSGDSNDSRGIRFSPTGDRLYIANRSPPSLQIYDTSLGASGVPNNDATGASDICREASSVAVLDPGDGERAYVTCFQDGQIYVVNPLGQSTVEDIIQVGRGPFGVSAIGGKNATDRKLLFVSNFLEDTIAVVDLSPGSFKRNRVVLRIGAPRTP
jgi:DNA-binding beta-propeller fold protein YncE